MSVYLLTDVEMAQKLNESWEWEWGQHR